MQNCELLDYRNRISFPTVFFVGVKTGIKDLTAISLVGLSPLVGYMTPAALVDIMDAIWEANVRPWDAAPR